MKRAVRGVIFSILLCAASVGCRPRQVETSLPPAALPSRTPDASLQTPSPAAPLPTLAPTALPTGTAPAQTVRLSPTPDCTAGLEFVADLTVPDGTYIARGVEVDKRWQVKNTGSCNWDSRYSLALVSGPELGLPAQQALYPARAGSEAVIRLLLTSPVIPGLYISAWQARDPLGEPFGDVIYVEFQVN